MVNCEYDTREKTDVIQVDIVKTIIQNSGGSRISPRRGRQLPRGRQHTILTKFPKKCMKLKEFGPPWGGASLAPPLDPPLQNGIKRNKYKKNKKFNS